MQFLYAAFLHSRVALIFSTHTCARLVASPLTHIAAAISHTPTLLLYSHTNTPFLTYLFTHAFNNCCQLPIGDIQCAHTYVKLTVCCVSTPTAMYYYYYDCNTFTQRELILIAFSLSVCFAYGLFTVPVIPCLF